MSKRKYRAADALRERHEKMTYSEGLIKWESGGLDDVPTELLGKYIEALLKEARRRGDNIVDEITDIRAKKIITNGWIQIGEVRDQ